MKKAILLAALFSFAAVPIASASNQILLKSGHFTPPEGITTFTKLSIETIPGRAHIIIQLKRIPPIQQRKNLEAQGIKLLSYIPDNAWFATIPSDKVDEITALSDVTAICEILIDDKISPQIRESGINEYSMLEDEKAKLGLILKSTCPGRYRSRRNAGESTHYSVAVNE